MRLIFELIRPYRWPVAGIFSVLLVQIVTGLAAPWPLKIVLDSVVGHHPLPAWLHFNPTDRTFWGTPAGGDVAVLQIRVIADDHGNQPTHADFTLRVAGVPVKPVEAKPEVEVKPPVTPVVDPTPVKAPAAGVVASRLPPTLWPAQPAALCHSGSSPAMRARSSHSGRPSGVLAATGWTRPHLEHCSRRAGSCRMQAAQTRPSVECRPATGLTCPHRPHGTRRLAR